ncbi:pilin [Patescibacteria group bacterium]|nr:pilin [Patescibacteria group bacterium]MBU1448218.1 pilin [Patescibacteria group bacterium]MBU2612997.1 pilin [Patescibacteria group bacterium]
MIPSARRTTFLRIATLAMVSAWSFLAVAPASAISCCECISSNNPKSSICIKTSFSCSKLTEETRNPNVKDLICAETLNEAKCATIAQGGICSSAPTDEILYTAPATTEKPNDDAPPLPKPPVLGISIPRLEFSEDIFIGGGEILVPWIAQYISAAYKYLLGTTIIAAAVMIVYGGFLYIVGSTVGSIEKGKAAIFDAIIGLLLILGSYTIFATINPATVSPTSIQIKMVERDAFLDPKKEYARVMEAATVKAPAQGMIEIPVIDAPYEGVPISVPSTPPSQVPTIPSSGSAPAPTPLEPGQVVTDKNGNLVAQGNCPSDMVPIKHSQAYTEKTGKTVESFCIDRYEAPNIQGQMPFNGYTEVEADWYCHERGKRLCSSSEWVRACLGPNGENTYGYGSGFIVGEIISAFDPSRYNGPTPSLSDAGSRPPVATGKPKAPCNYDSNRKIGLKETTGHALDPQFYPLAKSADESIWSADNKKIQDSSNAAKRWPQKLEALKQYLAAITGAEPSGSRSCVSEEGPIDMTANVQEISLTDASALMTIDERIQMAEAYNRTCPAKGDCSGTKPYTWHGFFWEPVAHLANPTARPTCTVVWGKGHAVGWRAMENGFRCCMNLSH